MLTLKFNKKSLMFHSAMALTCLSTLSAQEQKPNVIFFLVDDMGWNDVACFGSNFYETPNIDSLSRVGVKFFNAYTTCQVSSPARASILTGKYPASLNLTDWLPGRRDYPFQKLQNVRVNQELPKNELTIAETLRENGYHTAIIGKWHLSEVGSRPQEYGFDIHIPDGYLMGWPTKGYYAPFGMNGFDGNEGEYLTDRITTEAIQYIEKNKGEPFFLFLSHFAVHDPIEGRKDLVEKYRKKLKEKSIPDIAPYILEGNPSDFDIGMDSNMILDSLPHKLLPHRMVRVKQIQDNIHYAAMVESVDESMGRIMGKLKELGIDENTIIIFFSDNGGMSAANYGNPNRIIPDNKVDAAYSTAIRPLRGGKGWMYEGGIRVPLIIKWPQSQMGGVECNVPVVSTDFYPTILSMLNINIPTGKVCEGQDISCLLKGQNMEERSIYWYVPHYSNHGMQSPSAAVREGRYKLIEYFENNNVQLFDLENDMKEETNLASVYPDKVSHLRQNIHSWLKNIDAKELSMNPDYDCRVATAWEHEVYPVKKWELHSNYLSGQSKELIENGREYLLAYNVDVAFKEKAVGDWIHAATLAYAKNENNELKKKLDRTVDRLLKGIISDLNQKKDSDRMSEKDLCDLQRTIYGIIAYASYFPDVRITSSCEQIGDWLVTHLQSGIKDAELFLEPLLLLYEYTDNREYLNSVKSIMKDKKNIDRMNRDVREANYPLIAMLSGSLKYYQLTGESKYLDLVVASWKRLSKANLTSTSSNSNISFSDMLWMELCLHLYDLTGMRIYLDQGDAYIQNLCLNGNLNTERGQLLLELFEKHIAGEIDNALSVATLKHAEVKLSGKFGGGKANIGVSGKHGDEISIKLYIDEQPHIFKNYLVEFRIPLGMTLQNILLNDRKLTWNLNKRGFVSVQHLWKKGDVIKLKLKKE